MCSWTYVCALGHEGKYVLLWVTIKNKVYMSVYPKKEYISGWLTWISKTHNYADSVHSVGYRGPERGSAAKGTAQCPWVNCSTSLSLGHPSRCKVRLQQFNKMYVVPLALRRHSINTRRYDHCFNAGLMCCFSMISIVKHTEEQVLRSFSGEQTIASTTYRKTEGLV